MKITVIKKSGKPGISLICPWMVDEPPVPTK
jgi:hypothetical protein